MYFQPFLTTRTDFGSDMIHEKQYVSKLLKMVRNDVSQDNQQGELNALLHI